MRPVNALAFPQRVARSTNTTCYGTPKPDSAKNKTEPCVQKNLEKYRVIFFKKKSLKFSGNSILELRGWRWGSPSRRGSRAGKSRVQRGTRPEESTAVQDRRLFRTPGCFLVTLTLLTPPTPPEMPALCQLLLKVRAREVTLPVGRAFQQRQGLRDAYPNNLLTFLL